MDISYRALLLCAGYGTRLRPLTSHTHKCLVPIGGKPLLNHWLIHLCTIGCKAALINTHYLADQIDEVVAKWDSDLMPVSTVYEPNLLGTAATLRNNLDFFSGFGGLLIHGDNATNANLQGLFQAHSHRPDHCLLTMLTFKSSNPSSCGIVETDSLGVVKAFYEKVENPPGDCANGAVYLFDPPFIEWFKKLGDDVTDFSSEVLSKLVGRIQTWHVTEPYFDIGTHDALLEAQTVLDLVEENT